MRIIPDSIVASTGPRCGAKLMIQARENAPDGGKPLRFWGGMNFRPCWVSRPELGYVYDPDEVGAVIDQLRRGLEAI